MENRALGKGLSALIPDKDLSEERTASVAYLKTATIQDNAFQPRANYNDEKLRELIASIKEKGVLQPILVRRKGDGHEVVAGERRLKAARELGLEEVPVIIKDVSDEEALVLALVENIQREELNPIEEAQSFRRLIEEFHFTQDSVAQSVGKDRSTISNLLRLLKLPEEIQASVFRGELSAGHARALLGVEDSDKQMRLFQLTVGKNISVRELENLIKREPQHTPRRQKKTAQTDVHLAMIEEDLRCVLGTKVRIQSQKKRGKISIEYYSYDDLDRILSLIKR